MASSLSAGVAAKDFLKFNEGKKCFQLREVAPDMFSFKKRLLGKKRLNDFFVGVHLKFWCALKIGL